MKRKYKALIKLNFVSLFFIAVSFISITMAWFAYSGLVKTETNIDVKAWYIEFQKNGETVSNEITISLDEIYPGMEPKLETISIKNLGDSDASIKYEITSARILNETFNSDENNLYINDKLSHDYPFHINVGLSKNYATKETGTSELDVSVSWPLDSGTDEVDSTWGINAHQFKEEEEKKQRENPEYQMRSPLKITISLKAEQAIETPEARDLRYTLGDIVLYNPTTNMKCTKISSTCLKTNIIDVQNKVGDETVTLLPDLFKSYGLTSFKGLDSSFTEITSRWKATSEKLSTEALLKIISTDITGSIIQKENLSDTFLGYMDYGDRATKTIEEIKLKNGSFTFINEKFPFLVSSNCFWLTDYNETEALALSKIDETKSQIAPRDKTNSCSTLPIIKVPKEKLN